MKIWKFNTLHIQDVMSVPDRPRISLNPNRIRTILVSLEVREIIILVLRADLTGLELLRLKIKDKLIYHNWRLLAKSIKSTQNGSFKFDLSLYRGQIKGKWCEEIPQTYINKVSNLFFFTLGFVCLSTLFFYRGLRKKGLHRTDFRPKNRLNQRPKEKK